MIHAYHCIFGVYGFWLPNDPRGSWSDFVRTWELLRFGEATKVSGRRSLAQKPHDHKLRLAAKEALMYPPVLFTGVQAQSVGLGFKHAIERSGYVLYACAILPDHVHAVIARPRYHIEYVVGQLKGEATKRLKQDGLHPLACYAGCPSPWAQKGWNVYLNDEEAIIRAIQYVEDNPLKEDKPRQNWSFVTRYIRDLG